MRRCPSSKEVLADTGGAAARSAWRRLGRSATIATPAGRARCSSRAARDRDPRVQQAVFAASARSAARAQHGELAKVQARDEHARRQLALTKALVADRHGLPGPFLPGATGRSRLTRRSSTAPLSLSAKTPKATSNDLAGVRGPMFGLPAAPRGYALRCGRREWTIFIHEDLGTLRAQKRLTERPWIAAVLGSWYSDRLLAVTQYVVLTRPDSGAAHIDVVRSDPATGGGCANCPSDDVAVRIAELCRGLCREGLAVAIVHLGVQHHRAHVRAGLRVEAEHACRRTSRAPLASTRPGRTALRVGSWTVSIVLPSAVKVASALPTGGTPSVARAASRRRPGSDQRPPRRHARRRRRSCCRLRR